jgi:hypothetical protein
MSDYNLTIPENLYDKARRVAEETTRPVDEVIRSHLERAFEDERFMLSDDEHAELQALAYLSDDALWTIAREQMPDAIEARAHELLNRQANQTLSDDEQAELALLLDRADRLTLRKAEAVALLRQRGNIFAQADFNRADE